MLRSAVLRASDVLTTMLHGFRLHLAVVSGQCLELDTEAQVAADGKALLPGHRDDRGAIVLKNLRRSSLDVRRNASVPGWRGQGWACGSADRHRR